MMDGTYFVPEREIVVLFSTEEAGNQEIVLILFEIVLEIFKKKLGIKVKYYRYREKKNDFSP